jgi:CheY-like chemotaxis protein
VLVVDDDSLVASVVARALADYDVHVELNGRTAVGRVEAGEAFDLLLCDIMMPEMTGIEVHAAVSRADPALGARTVFMTGGVFNEIVRSFLESVPNRRLAKPFTLRELRLICASTLAQADEGERPPG